MNAVAAHDGRRGHDLEFRLLGPFEVRVNGQVLPSRRGQQAIVLAILLIKTGRIVPVESLIEYLWGTDRPKAARSTVQTYVTRIRSILRPYGFQIVTRGEGYQVGTDSHHRVDVEEFDALANRAFLAPNPAERVQLLEQALGLWRGPLLVDTADGDLRRRLGGGLVDLAFTCLEARAEARLALRQHSIVINELSGVVQRHPTREPLVANLMTALYRAGRQAEALRLYETTRRALLDGPGVEPGRQLWELYRRILRVEHPSDQLVSPANEVRVRDERLPWIVGGHPALDFCNTFAGWGRESLPGTEWLISFRALAVWMSYISLVEDVAVDRLLKSAQTDPGQAGDVLDDARKLRANIHACLTEPGDEKAFEHLARYAEAAAKVSIFVRSSDHRGRWRVDDASAGLRLPIYAVAREAADLLGDHRVRTVRTCANPSCGWLFLDESGMRRWCNPGTCGSSDFVPGKNP